MHNPKLNLERANAILKLLNDEKICTSPYEKKLNPARKLTSYYAQNSQKIAPGLTSCVATTLLKVGLCQELAQRFVLEYCLKYKEKNVSLIFLSNPSIGHTSEDHTFVCVGSITVPDELIIGRGNASVTVDPKNANQSLSDFLKTNNEGTFADPLLNCAGVSKEEITPLLEYCKKYNLTHVVGVRSFANTPNFVENAPIIKNNAIEIAEEIKKNTKGMIQWESEEKVTAIQESNETKDKELSNKNESKLRKGFFTNPKGVKKSEETTKTKLAYREIYNSIQLTEIDKKEIEEFNNFKRS